MFGKVKMHLLAAVVCVVLVALAWPANGAPTDIGEHGQVAPTDQELLVEKKDAMERRMDEEGDAMRARVEENRAVNADPPKPSAAPAAGGGDAAGAAPGLPKPNMLMVGLFLAATKYTLTLATH